MSKLALMMGLALLLTACSAQYTSNGEQHYVQSHNGVGIVVTPPLSTANISHFYDLPSQSQDAKVSIVPPV